MNCNLKLKLYDKNVIEFVYAKYCPPYGVRY